MSTHRQLARRRRAQPRRRSARGCSPTCTSRCSVPGIATAALLVFVEVLKELPATALLRPARRRHAGDRGLGGDEGVALRRRRAARAADRRRRARAGRGGDPPLYDTESTMPSGVPRAAPPRTGSTHRRCGRAGPRRSRRVRASRRSGPCRESARRRRRGRGRAERSRRGDGDAVVVGEDPQRTARRVVLDHELGAARGAEERDPELVAVDAVGGPARLDQQRCAVLEVA